MPATPTYAATLASGNGTGTTLVLTLSSAMSRAGVPCALFVAWASTTVTLSSVTDSRSNTWALEPTGTGTAVRGALATCLVPTTPLRAGDTLTVTLSGSVAKVAVLVELFGVKQSGTPRDGTIQSGSGAGSAGTSQAVASGNLATANAADLLLGYVATNVNLAADALAATGWSTLALGRIGGVSLHPAYRAVAATGSYDLNGTVSGGGSSTRAWLAAQYAFKASDLSDPFVSFVGAEVASVQAAGRAVSFVAAEVAYAATHAALSFVGAEIAFTAPAPAGGGRRPPPLVLA
jgi:hypothetical protein